MEDFDDFYGSRFLSASDVKAPVNATIERIDFEQFTRPGEPTRTKAVVYFKGGKKGMVINKTNANTLAEAFGKKFAGWVEKRVTVKAEPTTFAGKLTRGLRLYPFNGEAIAAPAAPPPPKAPPTNSGAEFNDEIPW
jgi:hypothetical protein